MGGSLTLPGMDSALRLGKMQAILRLGGVMLVLATAPRVVIAQSAIDEAAPWPRVRSTNGHTVIIHLPQVEHWTSNWFAARAVVQVKPAHAKTDLLGVIWFEAHGQVDRSTRIVTLDRLEIKKGRFPEATDNGSNALAIVREVMPAGARTVSLDYLVTALGFEQAITRPSASGAKPPPPDIIWATNRTVLILTDGEPVLRPLAGAAFERVINTPELLVREKSSSRFYLASESRWFAADSLKGEWCLIQTPPAALAELTAAKSGNNSPPDPQPPPRILVSTRPAELVVTDGMPDFRPVRGTTLYYAADCDNLLFLFQQREFYLLLSGRWFKAGSLKGPWNQVAPRDLPRDFAKISPNSPVAAALASVPDTPQAELAVVANSVPVTATIDRHQATVQVTYDGEPKFKPIAGTRMTYALNAGLPVIHSEDKYYAIEDGVWFAGGAPTGPWQVATEVPEEIYTIPPDSPVYYATFARVYDSDADSVEVGYTPGYVGAYEEDGTMVYGTGWSYEPWYGDDYYGWGWTWGYSYVYVPWYQWWVWRPWWNERGGLRAALIDNVYNRWSPANGITPHDAAANSGIKPGTRHPYDGYPAVYGRFKATPRAAALDLPANTLALNPYARPQNPVRPGNTPHGAQLLTDIRQTPGGGRDLFASPDGNVYRRKNDGWYRREATGNWAFFAAAQGPMERNQVRGGAMAAGQQSANGGQPYRIAAGARAGDANALRRGDRLPDSGVRAQSQEVAALERQYYARALADMRSQNSRPFNGGRGGRLRGRR